MPNGARVPTTGRLQEGTTLPDGMQISCAITVSDGIASLSGSGRCDDGSYESIFISGLWNSQQSRVLEKLLRPVILNVALKTGHDPQSFSFSRSWTSQRTVLHLAPGNLALVMVTFSIVEGRSHRPTHSSKSSGRNACLAGEQCFLSGWH